MPRVWDLLHRRCEKKGIEGANLIRGDKFGWRGQEGWYPDGSKEETRGQEARLSPDLSTTSCVMVDDNNSYSSTTQEFPRNPMGLWTGQKVSAAGRVTEVWLWALRAGKVAKALVGTLSPETWPSLHFLVTWDLEWIILSCSHPPCPTGLLLKYTLGKVLEVIIITHTWCYRWEVKYLHPENDNMLLRGIFPRPN